MLILQVINDWFSPYRQHLYDFNQLTQVIGTGLIGAYVILTYLMFKQIKKQTDFQQNAYLKITISYLKNIPEKMQTGISGYNFGSNIYTQYGPIIYPQENYIETYLQEEPAATMRGLSKKIFTQDASVLEGKFYTLQLTNYGNIEINKISLRLQVDISNSDEVVKKFLLQKNTSYNLEVTIDEIIERNRGQINVPLISTAAFPIWRIKLSGEYTDVKNKNYKIEVIESRGENDHLQKLHEA